MKKSLDNHLNIFWNYNNNNNQYLEDNLTRAFITTFSILPKEQKIEFINFFINESLSFSDDLEISVDLQNPYLDINNEIKTAKKRVMVGFNPTGKTWGSEEYKILDNIDKYNFKKEDLESKNYQHYLKKSLNLSESQLKEVDFLGRTYSEKIRDIILTHLNKGKARPDAWIFIHKNKKLEIAIAIETKLWDLDPHQLANHCEKCLSIPKEETLYRTFKETFDIFSELKNKDRNPIITHFLDYTEMIGHYINTPKITREDFNRVFTLNEDDSKIGKNILNKKLNNLFENYFNSKNYLELSEKYNLKRSSSKPRYIYIKGIVNDENKGFGNIYFDIEVNKENKTAFFIGTEIGVSRSWENREFSKRLKDKDFLLQCCKLYPKTILNSDLYEIDFQVCLRINQIAFSDYIGLYSSNDLNKILTLKSDIEYQPKLTKLQYLDQVKKFINVDNASHINDKISVLESRGTLESLYNTMSYLRFIDYIKQEYILDISSEEFNVRFSVILEKHLKGLSTLYDMTFKNKPLT